MKFSLYYFLIAILVGFFIVYITSPKPKVVIKYPTPKNNDKITYIDDNDVCYKYKKINVPCPKNQKTIKY